MKKLLALLLTLVMCLSLAACGGSGTDTSGTDTSSGETGEDSGDSSYRVAMICDSSISDGGWGMSCYNAMVDAAAERGWATEVSDSIAQSAYYDTIISYCDLGYDLIYAPGNQYTDAVLQAAEEFPDVAFALLNGGEDTPAKAVNGNVTSLLPNAQQVGWIAGALAGLMTKSGTVAFIGAMELDTTLGKYNGFKEAAAYVGQQEGKTVSTLDVVYSGDFSAADKGIEFAKAMIDQGADVFFGDASAVDSGARQAIDEANAASGSVSIYDIAQPSDLLGQNECIIGSQVTDNASLVGLCMEAVEDGSFGGEVIYGTLQNGALSAGALSDLVPADVQEKYQGYLDQIVDGSFTAVRFIPANHCGSIQMPGWSRFPPCPGNFCPTVERGLQCRALDGGQPLPSSLGPQTQNGRAIKNRTAVFPIFCPTGTARSALLFGSSGAGSSLLPAVFRFFRVVFIGIPCGFIFRCGLIAPHGPALPVPAGKRLKKRPWRASLDQGDEFVRFSGVLPLLCPQQVHLGPGRGQLVPFPPPLTPKSRISVTFRK